MRIAGYFPNVSFNITVWVRVRMLVTVRVRAMVSVTVMVRVSKVLGLG